jgi:hypothetical protein
VERTRGKGGVRGMSLMEYVYGDDEGGDGSRLTDDVEAFRKKTSGLRTKEEEEALEKRMRSELERVLMWSREKFGEGEWKDATSAWVKNSEEVSQMNADMVSGGKGFREF